MHTYDPRPSGRHSWSRWQLLPANSCPLLWQALSAENVKCVNMLNFYLLSRSIRGYFNLVRILIILGLNCIVYLRDILMVKQPNQMACPYQTKYEVGFLFVFQLHEQLRGFLCYIIQKELRT